MIKMANKISSNNNVDDDDDDNNNNNNQYNEFDVTSRLVLHRNRC